MSNPTFIQISGAVAADVATNGTITLAYPAGQSSSTVKAAGAQLWSRGLMNMLAQAAGGFSVAYSGSITITYLGSTTIPAGSLFDFYLPVPDAEDALTDNTGGTASETLAAITAPAANATTSLTADMTAVKNAIASLAAKQSKMQTALKNANINPV